MTVDQTKDGQTTLFVLGPPKGSGRQASNALRRSTDRGHTWTDLSTALIRAADSSGNGRIERMRRIATNQAQPDVLYLSADLRTASGGYRHGVFKSTDAGDSWTYLFPQPKSLDRIRDDRRKAKMPEYEPGWLPIEFSWGWGGNAMFLSTNQADPDQILWTDMGRTIGSKDGGTSWHGLYSKRGEDGYYGSRGLEATPISATGAATIAGRPGATR